VTYKDQMIRHLQAAERAEDQIDQIEHKVTQNLHFRNPRLRAVALKRALEDNQLHKQLSGSKGSHVAMATMYGIAALVEEAGS
jgi:hypothetical protein